MLDCIMHVDLDNQYATIFASWTRYGKCLAKTRVQTMSKLLKQKNQFLK
jgi:hypothetical protein